MLPKLRATDVDGVLTNGGMYYDEHFNELKKFNVSDGVGVIFCKLLKIHVDIFTGENTQYPFSGRQTWIRCTQKQERLRGGIIANIGVLSIRTSGAGQHYPLGIRCLEILPGDQLGRDQLKLRAGQLADNGLAGELLPPGKGLVVPHNQIAVAQIAGDAQA